MSLPIEHDQALFPAGWCWCTDHWIIAGLPDFVEGGKLHRRDGCWRRLPAPAQIPLTDALGVTFPCCPDCPCTGRQHTTACTVEGCSGQVGS